VALLEYPKLRQIEAFPVETGQGKMICIKDSYGYCQSNVIVSPAAFFIIASFDGKHSVRDIQVKYTRQFGDILVSDRIKELINQMDEHFLLESEKFSELKRKTEEEFRKQEVRHSTTGNYPDKKEKLMERLREIFSLSDEEHGYEPVKGLIAPHIDYDRGEACYGKTYKFLKDMKVDLFVIFGTSHRDGKNLFILTEKDFETPLGRIKTDKELVRNLARSCTFDIFEDEILHKGEHSIELQVPFIQYLFGNNVEILPVLCTNFSGKIKNLPAEDEHFSIFIKSLKGLLKESNKKICFIAGADFSHVGFNFGDNFPLNRSLVKEIERKDLKTISHIEQMDSEGFYKSVKADEDFRKICGLPPVYALMSVIDAEKGKLISYDQWMDYNINSTVSFAGIRFY
jgi:AmmeMemoRadiSam system protein B